MKTIYCKHCENPLAIVKSNTIEPKNNRCSITKIKKYSGEIKCRKCSNITNWQIENQNIEFRIDYKKSSQQILSNATR